MDALCEYIRLIPDMVNVLTQLVDQSVSHYNSRLAWAGYVNSTINYNGTPEHFIDFYYCKALFPYLLHAIQEYGDMELYQLTLDYARIDYPDIAPVPRGPLEIPQYFRLLDHKGSWRVDLIQQMKQPRMVDGNIEKTHTKILRMAQIIDNDELIQFVMNQIDIMDGCYEGLPRKFLHYLEERGMERILLNNNFTYRLNDPIISQHILKTYGRQELIFI